MVGKTSKKVKSPPEKRKLLSPIQNDYANKQVQTTSKKIFYKRPFPSDSNRIYNNTNNNETYMESNFKSVSPTANKYTQSLPFIKNKEMTLLEKYVYENDKYQPDRVKIHNMKKINPIKNKSSILYKTTVFRNNQYIMSKNEKINDEIDYEKLLNKKKYINHFYVELEEEKQKKKEMNKYKPSNSLYKELTLKKNEIFSKYFQNNGKPKNLYKNSNKNAMLTGYDSSWLLTKNKIDASIPIVFPVALTNTETYNSLSEETRISKGNGELMKLKYLISLDKKTNKNLYIKEFLRKKGINKKYVTEENINNFWNYLEGDFKIDKTKSFKDNIIKALLYGKNTNQINKESIPVDKNAKTKTNISTISKVSYSIPLENQKVLTETSEIKNKDELVKELQKELNLVKEEIKMQQFGYSPTSFLKHIHTIQPSSDINSISNTYNIMLGKSEDENTLQNITTGSNTNTKPIKKDLNAINRRLYYSKMEKLDNFDINIYKKKSKLTEYVMLELTKNKIAVNQIKSKFDPDSNA